ncbi:MAG TPA: nucleotide exchange factor GrpE [Rhizomicrobium sp.]|jgi:molecular chaperone GrpE|nr:nucleotide exchange factor GrpE [Rhizomicrobium sp.]
MSDDQNNNPSAANDGENPFAAEFAVLEALKAEVESLKDQRLRALAEVENVRRRAEKERADASQYAVTKFARDMLGIADNFARALAAVPADIRAAADPQVKAVLDGVEATDRQLLQTLERYGVKAVDTSDGKFDPNLHQAIAEVPGNGKPPGSIVDVVQAGFTIGDRLLRPAMVTVAKKDMPAQPVSVDTKV